MYITILEKLKAIDDDFKKSQLYTLGELPSAAAQQRTYFRSACAYASAYIEKYQGYRGTPMYEYVKDLVTDYMEYLERTSKQIREGSKHETNT